MRIEKPNVEVIQLIDGKQALKHIERIGRICYKSEDKITDDSYENFVNMIIKRGHEAVIEHSFITAIFKCDRGVTHEIVRHRLFSYAQESTRYCNYTNDKFGKEITVIYPCFLEGKEGSFMWNNWYNAMIQTESSYLSMIDNGATPQEARSVLPNSLKTEIAVSGNFREWKHFFSLRTAKAAHPQMQEVAKIALEQFQQSIPIVFDNL
jgi:thymidylate synthase (FAD)